MRAACVETAARLPVRHRAVPRDPALEAGDVGDELGEIADRDLVAGTEVDRLPAVVALGGERQPVDTVVDVEELAGGRAVAPEHDLVPALEHLPDQVGDHVRVRLVEVVAGPVEVRGQEVRRAEPVLVPVGLRAHEHRLLGDAVGRVRLLGEAVPELVLAERHRCELGVRTDGADDDQLLDLVQPGLLEHVRPHHQVRVPVAAGVGAVRADSADLGCEVEDELRARVLEQAGRRVHRRQVVVTAARREHVVAVRCQPLGQPRAQEAAAAGDERPHVASPGL